AGHTDAKGSETYNQGLSERRSDAVKRFLAEKYGIETNRLLTVGYGATKLKNSESPLAGENRRVQIVNTSDKEGTAARPIVGERLWPHPQSPSIRLALFEEISMRQKLPQTMRPQRKRAL